MIRSFRFWRALLRQRRKAPATTKRRPPGKGIDGHFRERLEVNPRHPFDAPHLAP